MKKTPLRLPLLKNILIQPSAPFREYHVIKEVTQILTEYHVPHFQDPIGNIIIGVSSVAEYSQLLSIQSHEPLKIYMAHMDHPGFHGVKWIDSQNLRVKWFGGSPTRDLEGAEVWLANRSGYLPSGQMFGAELLKNNRAISSATIRVPVEFKDLGVVKAPSVFGGFGFGMPFWEDEKLIYTKAADDLVGTFAILSLAIDLWGKLPALDSRSHLHRRNGITTFPGLPIKASKFLKKHKGNTGVLGILTRAEEVGFIGAIGHFQLGWLNKAKRPILCVSLETSRALPGAEIGKGPVVRLGDRYTVFDAGALKIFSEIAEKTMPSRYQKRIMDGGTCEATAATVFGFPCVGISIPLGNYHNQALEGGPKSRDALGPAPEFVHTDDVEGMLELCHGLLAEDLPWARPWEEKKKDFIKEFRNSRALLAKNI